MKRKHLWFPSMTTDEFVKAIKKHDISSCSIVLGKYGWIEIRNYNSGLDRINTLLYVKRYTSLSLRISPYNNGIRVRGVFGFPTPLLLVTWMALLSFLLAYIKNVGFGLDALIFFIFIFIPLCIVSLLIKRALEYGMRNQYEADNQALIYLINSISIASTHKKAESSDIEHTKNIKSKQ